MSRSTSTVAVLDYGSGNLHSVVRALTYAGAAVELTADPAAAGAADGLVVPGVGAFAACMDQLRAVGGPAIIKERVAAARPVLGICVGHQVLFSAGEEHGADASGVGIFPGTIRQLPAERLPHMGWNEVVPGPGARFFPGVRRFYFVHSYAALAADDLPREAVAMWTNHAGVDFISAVEYGPVLATQFHPEKSGEAGHDLLRRWVESLAG